MAGGFLIAVLVAGELLEGNGTWRLISGIVSGLQPQL
jgi:hypothetical protein